MSFCAGEIRPEPIYSLDILLKRSFMSNLHLLIKFYFSLFLTVRFFTSLKTEFVVGLITWKPTFDLNSELIFDLVKSIASGEPFIYSFDPSVISP